MPRPRVDYDEHGRTYVRHRRADPRFAARIKAALGDARTVVNVGAGSGSYEPADQHGHLREQGSFDGALRLVISEP